MKPKHTSTFGQKQSKPKKITQERIGIALYGLQGFIFIFPLIISSCNNRIIITDDFTISIHDMLGLNHKLPSVSALLSEISPQFDHFPQLDGKTIGMSLHAFKFSTGSLSPEQEKVSFFFFLFSFFFFLLLYYDMIIHIINQYIFNRFYPA